MKLYKLYLFDFDGTLFDTLESYFALFEEAFKATGVRCSPEECLQLTRIPLKEGFLKLGGKEEDFRLFVQKVNEYLEKDECIRLSKLYDDTLECIKYFNDRNIDIGIVTSNNVPHVKKVLDLFNIKHNSFQIYVGNQESKKHKPDPEPILKAIELGHYTLDKKDIVYIGDSKNDCLSAINAGVNPILLDRHFEYEGAEYPLIHSLRDLFVDE